MSLPRTHARTFGKQSAQPVPANATITSTLMAHGRWCAGGENIRKLSNLTTRKRRVTHFLTFFSSTTQQINKNHLKYGIVINYSIVVVSGMLSTILETNK